MKNNQTDSYGMITLLTDWKLIANINGCLNSSSRYSPCLLKTSYRSQPEHGLDSIKFFFYRSWIFSRVIAQEQCHNHTLKRTRNCTFDTSSHSLTSMSHEGRSQTSTIAFLNFTKRKVQVLAGNTAYQHHPWLNMNHRRYWNDSIYDFVW